MVLVPSTSAFVPNSPSSSPTLVSTSFALVPDSKLTHAISRGQAATVLSERHNKEQRKRTQRRPPPCLTCFCSVSCHRACRVTSVHTLSTTTKEVWKQQVQCNVDGQSQTTFGLHGQVPMSVNPGENTSLESWPSIVTILWTMPTVFPKQEMMMGFDSSFPDIRQNLITQKPLHARKWRFVNHSPD